MRRSFFLPVFRSNALAALEALSSEWRLDPGSARKTFELATEARRAAIAGLLLSAEGQPFWETLQFTGQILAEHLRSAEARRMTLARSTAFFDALAGGNIEVAREIARLARRGETSPLDAPEDAWFVEAFMGLALGEDASALERTAEAWKACLQGTEDLRLEVFRALSARRTEDLIAALHAWLRLRRTQWTDENLHAPEVVATEGSVSVEALGILELAAGLGLDLDDHFLGAPWAARRSSIPSRGSA